MENYARDNYPAPNTYKPEFVRIQSAAPSYSMKSRPKQSKAVTANPPPNQYKPDTKPTVKKAPEYSMKSRTQKGKPPVTVAPNQYTPKRTKTSIDKTLASRTMRPGLLEWELKRNKNVAPNAYHIDTPKTAVAYTMKSRHDQKVESIGPGPAKYDSQTPYRTTKPQSAKYSMKSRPNELSSNKNKLAPNAYKQDNPYKKSPSYTMSGRPAYRGINIGASEFRYKFFL